MELIVKKHISHEGKIIIAICDKDLLGKKFEQGELQLDLTSNFYKGDLVNEDEIKKILKNAHLMNIVGENSINFVVNNGFIKKENILKIDNIPYAQALILKEDE
tara:strand:+ start:233 stop:544 length:312 start_codon:yes stop_codon:yes gene_type:complete